MAFNPIPGTIVDNSHNNSAQNVQDSTLIEGMTHIEILFQILLELRIQTQKITELPLLLNAGLNDKDDPQQYRNDPSIFKQ